MSRSITETHPHLEGLIRKWRATAASLRRNTSYGHAADEAEHCADELEAAIAAGGVGIVGWLHEDTLPDGYPYDAMFPHSKVDGVRMFPVYAPLAQALAALPGGGVDATAADLAELAYWRQSEAKFMDHLSQNDGLNHRQRIAEIRRALSPTPNPHEADQ